MTGISTTCKDNPRVGIVGCGARYGGELQHSVARVPWSSHPDGRAHITAALSVIDRLWMRGGATMAEPISQGFTVSGERVRWPAPDGPHPRGGTSSGGAVDPEGSE